MKPVLSICVAMSSVLLSGCTNSHGNYDLHKTLALVMIVAIVLLFAILSIYSNMLREEISDCNVFNAEAEKIKLIRGINPVKFKNPYSLSRVQLAIWTVIIGSSYIYLQLCKGNCDITDVNQTALILMGIGAGVTATGAIMNSREIQNNIPRHQNTPSKGFFIDVLSDQNGICIHRFQNVVWTGIAMIIYLTKVYAIKSGCELPELSGTLLTLTGISSATYLVVKSQENTTIPGNSLPPVSPVIVPPATPVAPNPIIPQPPAPVQPPIVSAPSVPPTSPIHPPSATSPAAGNGNITQGTTTPT